MPKRGADCHAPHCCDCGAKRRRRLVIFSDSSDSDEENAEAQRGPEAEATPSGDAALEEAAAVEVTVPNEDSPVPANTSDSANTSQDETANVAVDSSPTLETPGLDPEILKALGAKTDDEPEYGEKIHDNLSQLWTPLLKKGMSKEDKEKILKGYAIPENCKLLQAPKLNLEISAAISESARGRDKKIKEGQQQLGLGVTAINRGIDILLSKQENSTVNAIKHLSDACRILCDLHHTESAARIKIITPTLDKSFLNVIQDCQRDEMLFGNKLADKIKSSKTIEKQGLQIKKVVASATASTSSARQTQLRGNWSGPPRYTSNRGGRGSAKKTFAPRRPPPPLASQTSAAKTSKPQTRAQTHH